MINFLARGIDRDPMKLVRYAESECHAWFNVNDLVPPILLDHSSEESLISVWWMVRGLPQVSSVVVAGYGMIV